MIFYDAHKLSTAIGITRNIGWLITVCVGVIGGGLWGLGEATGSAIMPIATGVTLLGATLFTAGVRLVAKASRPAYSCESMAYTYEFAAGNLTEQTQRVVVRLNPRRDGTCLFPIRFNWTGSGRDEIKVTSPGHSLIEDKRRTDNGTRNFLVFVNEMRRGQEVVIELTQTLVDSARQFRPLLAKRINEPIGHLSLKAVFPKADAPAEVRTVVFEGLGPDGARMKSTSSKIKLSEVGASRVAEHHIPQPRLRWRYDLDWSPWPAYKKGPKRP